MTRGSVSSLTLATSNLTYGNCLRDHSLCHSAGRADGENVGAW